MATLAFNEAFKNNVHDKLDNNAEQDEESLYRVRTFEKINKDGEWNCIIAKLK